MYCPTSAGSLISSAQSAAQGTSLQEYAVRMSTAENAPQLEDFDSLAVLGKGGFGIVRLVRHRTTGSTYAVRGHLLSLSLSLSLFPSLSLSLSLSFPVSTHEDYTTVGYSTLVKEEKMVHVKGHEVVIGGAQRFHGVLMADVLDAVAAAIAPNPASLLNYRRMFVPFAGPPPLLGMGGPLTTNVLMYHIQGKAKRNRGRTHARTHACTHARICMCAFLSFPFLSFPSFAFADTPCIITRHQSFLPSSFSSPFLPLSPLSPLSPPSPSSPSSLFFPFLFPCRYVG